MSFRKAPTRVSATIGGKEIIIETGRVATQAHGSVTIQCGGTVVLVTVCSQPLDFDRGFFPLTVEYSERMYAAGRIQVGGQAVLGRQERCSTPWLTERHGYDPTSPLLQNSPDGYSAHSFESKSEAKRS